MAAYAEGLNILKHGQRWQAHSRNRRRTTRSATAEHYQYDFNLADVPEVWRRGSVVASWLLESHAISLLEQPTLERYSAASPIPAKAAGRSLAGIESGAPAPVLTESLYETFHFGGRE